MIFPYERFYSCNKLHTTGDYCDNNSYKKRCLTASFLALG
ncbi:hypothetical protein HMPREF9065_01973 [Aggregatibacter sp. oral taxon 458 str. W10330]|nr:hypothetical protein HMPREF9065_01973 [Aggregatibacter sp. oral taxon 458 str. W10330]